MRLKSLEIKGFKSFADKTLINLDNQITGIVGPNGCGKSNIVDAIRWVIGEHKIKTLRSDNLEDLIFNGSKSRNGSGLAEVALTFENTKNLLPTEFNTVTISRKFYKNGESEYRLNDVTCRLKDITNLFMDTGVTSDSYSIIELGMVDDIIKDKENSRRRMLEQAAGISIYKTRKKEAKQKLDLTEQDLNRIEDLLFEIANNLRTLESQAKKAEKYHAIKKEYKEVSIEYVKASLEDFNSTYQTLNVQQQQEVDKILEMDAKIATDGAELEQLKLELTQREEELHQLQKTFNEVQNQLRSIENDKNLSSQRIDHLKQLCLTIDKDLKDAELQTVQLNKAGEESKSKLSTEEDTLHKFKQKLEELRSELDATRVTYDEHKSQLDQLRQQHQQLQVQQFDAEKTVAIAENNINNQQRAIVQLQEEKATREQDIQHNQSKKQELDQEFETLNVLMKDLIQKQEEATQKLLDSQALLEEKRVALFEENRKLDATQNEYNLLKSLVDSLEGYPDSIKFLSKNNQWSPNAVLLSEVFNVQDEYRVCIENYLDKYLNYYVVDRAEEAYQAVAMLSDQKKGKAGFFILSETKRTEKDNSTLPGCISASDVIQIKDEKYRSLLNELSKKVFIVDGEFPDSAIEPGFIYLNKSGAAIREEHRIVGGSIGIFEGNKIGRTQRLEKLLEEIAQLKLTVQTLSAEIEETKALVIGYNQAAKDDQIKQTRSELNRVENAVVQTQHKLEHAQQQHSHASKRIEDLEIQLEQTQQSIADTQQHYQEMKQQLTLAFSGLQAGQERFAKAEASYNRANEEYNQHNLIITRQQSRINELNHETEVRENRLKEIAQRKEDNAKRLHETTIQVEQTESELKQLEERLYTSLQQKENSERVLNEKDQSFYVFRNQLNEKEAALNKQRKEKEASETQLTSIKDKLTEMKLQLASMKERLHVEFKVDIDDVLKQPRSGEYNLEELNQEVEKLKKRIDNLGEVNPMAVEAYKEMKGRHDFIQEQKADLTNAKESLLKTIEEVEATANLKFKDTFEKVKDNFIQVFHALFTEDDTCDMRLTDPENLADTGIEIYAQPKGKKPSTITQLSGGEKTLTSAAFLFAIYLIKPAPFCVLDEVDAPLDDANVGKFTNMIRKFSDNSQFIIVTHNKQTMASVDVIYGVTMQEAGVSKLVPVDFRSLN